MLLNEFLKEHRKMNEQQKQIDALTAQLKQQAAQIQKVSAQIGLSQPETKSFSIIRKAAQLQPRSGRRGDRRVP